MNRLHINLRVADLAEARKLYGTLLGQQPTFEKTDYAKWDIDNPPLSLSVTARGRAPALDHLGIKFESQQAFEAAAERMEAIGEPLRAEKNATCCYAQSDKGWWKDPLGLAWELFFTHKQVDELGGSAAKEVSVEGGSRRAACC